MEQDPNPFLLQNTPATTTKAKQKIIILTTMEKQHECIQFISVV